MILKQIEVKSSLIDDYTNCYIMQDEETKEAICIDPGGSIEKIIEMLKILNAKLKYIYLTHSHMDHIEKAEELKNTYGGEILISRKGAENINNPEINLFNMINFEANNISNIDNLSHEDNEQYKEGNLPKQLYTSVDSRVDDKDILHIGKIELEVILAPGHTNDGTSLYCKEEGIVFTGDTLMYMGYGRTDFSTGNLRELKKSLKKLFALPENTFVYPGHGIATTIGDEKGDNYDTKIKRY